MFQANRDAHWAVSLSFYSRENNEPPHIHVAREEMEAKFWLRPVSLAANHGFAKAELNHIEKPVEEHFFWIRHYRDWSRVGGLVKHPIVGVFSKQIGAIC